MERRKQTRGACTYCGRTLTRSGMRRHLEACPKRKARLAEADDGTGTRRTFLHLDVRDAYDGDYWLHLEMEGSEPLSTLDAYLRHIWLECCGHPSEFSIGRRRWHREVDMTRPAGQIFRPGVELTHVYDFGTSTVTTIRLAGERRGKATSRWPLVLMARNDAPELECHACGQPARWFCHECFYDDDHGLFCAEHQEGGHPHGQEGLLPVVNSPRWGLCGYTGPAEPPF